MRRDDHIYRAKDARYNNLLGKPGWKQLCHYIKNTKNIHRLLKTANAKQRRNTVKIKFGMKIPRDHKEAMMFDANNSNNNWKYDELLKLKQM